jgi:phospholipase/lecithinase/hemolysin
LGANSISNANWSNAKNDWSYFGQYSPNLVTNINHFVPPPDVQTALFVVWVNDADFVNDMATVYNTPNAPTNSFLWNTAITNSLNNHLMAINNLCAKGARTLIMPNAVDITEIPQYNGTPQANKSFVRQEVIYYNSLFTTLLQQQAALHGVTIYEPNFFGLLDNVITNASAYGLTNFQYGGLNESATSGFLPNVATNGPGTNFVFWDATDPTAKFHEIMADTAQQLVAPVSLGQVSVLSPSTSPVYTNQLQVLNMPVGLNGFVDGTTNIGQPNFAWTTVTNITGTSVAQSIDINVQPIPVVVSIGGDGSIYPGSGSGGPPISVPLGNIQAYRLRFPFAWSWP